MRKAAMWLEKYSNRYRWAYNAYQRFIDEVDPSLAGDFNRSSHVTVAVYGATQVGKTTLILDLLGVTGEALERASSVLRGDQRMGKSSTACAIRYGRSKDDYWYIGDDRSALDDEAARVRFSAIRTEMEEGRAQSVDVLSVRLPSKFFEHWGGDALSLDLRILDIPGINAVNEAEQAQVARVAEKYVATADLILLVGRADDLGFLHPNKLKLAALGDWMLQPNRYRVVLSYTFSPASFKTWFGQDERTLAQVRSKLYQELGTHDYKPPKSVEAMLYPLEFGDSLQSLGATPEYHQAAVKLIQQLRRELLASITESASPYGRLASAFKMKTLIDARLEREQVHYEKHRKDLEVDLQLALDELEQAEGLLSNCQKESGALDHHRRRLHRYLKVYQGSDVRRFFTQPLPSTTESVSALKLVAMQFENGIQAKWKAMCERHAHRQSNFRLAELSPPTTSALNSFYQKMNGYLTDGYWWSSENFRTDRSMLLGAAEKVVDAYTEAATQEIRKYMEHQANGLKRKYSDYQRRLAVMKTAVAERQQAVEGIQGKRHHLEQAHAQFKARMQFSMEHSHKFEQYILEAFKAELDRVREAIRRPLNAIEQLYDMFYLHVLLGELDKMLEGKKF
ncbi:dynamin family protein [Pseudomonas sp. P1B16]|uniref:dynamin family protein n=1 Tax=Pseudomonas TaxID=286 RepID=UPI001F208B22|nr:MULTISPECIES: dynamin family protein [Pseudomonas]WPM26004.1 dynamin family protein [Pseudomonas sp. P1B16]